MRALLVGAAALGAVAVVVAARPAPADAKASVRFSALEVLRADGKRVAKPPYRRDRRYLYRVEYRLAGASVLRVTRAGAILSPEGPVAIIRPPAAIADVGRYRATGRIRVDRSDPAGVYTLRYTIVVRGNDGTTGRRVKQIRMRFR